MSDTWVAIIAAIITGLFSLCGVYFSNRKSAALMEYRLKKLEEKVDLHNQVIDRTYKLETRMKVAETEIDDLKGKAS